MRSLPSKTMPWAPLLGLFEKSVALLAAASLAGVVQDLDVFLAGDDDSPFRIDRQSEDIARQRIIGVQAHLEAGRNFEAETLIRFAVLRQVTDATVNRAIKTRPERSMELLLEQFSLGWHTNGKPAVGWVKVILKPTVASNLETFLVSDNTPWQRQHSCRGSGVNVDAKVGSVSTLHPPYGTSPALITVCNPPGICSNQVRSRLALRERTDYFLFPRNAEADSRKTE